MAGNYNPKDLTINLRAATSGRYVLNGGPGRATFPGWFITVQENEGYDLIVGPIQLTDDEVVVITDVIDRTIDQTSASSWRVTNAAKRCSQAMRDNLRHQLEVAEAIAANIPELKKKLGLE